MKKILLFAFLLCSFSALAQYPATPTTKQELGRQTTGDGLIYRGSGAPAYTPSNNRNAWIYYDTTNNRLYKSRLGSWSLMVQDTSAFNEIQMPYIVDDTLYLTRNVTGEPLTAYVNRVWPIAALSDTASITGENQGDVAFVTGGTAVAFRGSSYWNPFSGGGGGGSFNSFDIAGDSGSSTITDGQTATIAGGYGINTAETGGTVTVTADTSQLATQNDISAAPSGTGTNQRIVVWTGTNSQGNSTQLQSAAGLTLDANLAYRITGGKTASRPTGAAGMMYWNTSNNWFDFHNGTSWFNPARSAYSTGLYTSTRVPFADANGLLTDGTGLTYTSGTGHFFIPSRLNVGGTTPSYAISNYTTSAAAASPWTNNAILLGLTNTGSTPSYTTLAFGTATQATALISARNITATTGELRFYTLGSFADPPDLFISSVGEIGIGTASPDRLLHPELSDAVTNAMSFPLRLTHITSGTAAAGSGAGMEFEAESAGGTNRVAGTIENPFTTATNAAEVSDLVFRTMRAGTLTESLRSLGNGTLQIATYTGTANGIAGKTSAGILTTIPEGHGINLTAGGALEVDTTQMATQSDLAVVAASVAAIPTPVFGKFTGTTDGGGLISITLSATPATGACTCTNNATSGASFRYLFSANWTSGTNVNVRVYDADAFLMLASGAVDFSIICY